MNRPFSSMEARTLMEQHQKLRQQALQASQQLEQEKNQVLDASNALLEAEVLELLESTGVEELNRDRSGLRIKALKEAGFHNLKQIRQASLSSLVAVAGISEEKANLLKKRTHEFAQKAREIAGITLSADLKTPQHTRLIQALYTVSRLEPAVRQIEALMARQDQGIRNALLDLYPASKGFQWLFLAKSKKQAAIDAWYLLRRTSGPLYAGAIRSLLEQIDAALAASPASAWKEFTTHPLALIQILQKINPGVLEKGDGRYGLPQKFLEQLQKVSFDLQGLKCTLRPYQKLGVQYILKQKRVLLGDEMGLGKTVQAIAAMQSLANQNHTRFLVVAPASVLTNWKREIENKSTLVPTLIHGPTRQQAFEAWLEKGGTALTTYDSLRLLELPERFSLDMLVVDEAHYIKNPQALRTRQTAAFCQNSQYVLFMSGTPLENKVEEMVSLIGMLQPEVAARIEEKTYIAAAPQFRQDITSVYYRRRRTDVLAELPDLVEKQDWCALSGEELDCYEQAVLSRNFAQARRVSWNVEDLSSSSKARRMLEIIEEAKADGRKVIVFSYFLKTIQAICSLLPAQAMPPIQGSVSPARRQEIIDAFEKAPAGTVLPAQILSGGTGLNIQSASVVILCEPQFKPSIENQAISRSYRMGQPRSVLVHRLLCTDSVDERICALLEQKQELFDEFASQSEAANAQDQLQELQVDTAAFSQIMDEEYRRIQEKYEQLQQDRFATDQDGTPIRIPEIPAGALLEQIPLDSPAKEPAGPSSATHQGEGSPNTAKTAG